MKAIDRLFDYINIKGLKPTRFEKEVGLSNGYLQTQKKRSADLGEGVLNKIIDYCIDINVEWLLTGRGSMLRDELETATAEPIIIYKSDPKDAELIAAKQLIIERDAELIDSLRSKINELEAQLNDHTMVLRSAPAADIPPVRGSQTSAKP